METRQLLEVKMARLAESKDEPKLAFLTTMLTGGGISRKEYGYPQGFSEFRTAWGDAKFEETKNALKEEGLLREDDTNLVLNLQGFENIEETERQSLIIELSQFLFEKAHPFFANVLKETFALSEGRYILNELVKVGPTISDDSVSHISQAAGHKYWQQVTQVLSRAGLFIHWFSSKKHDYYRLFLALISLVKAQDKALKDALAYIYVAQNVRQGCGVLTRDLDVSREIDLLTLQGMIKQEQWYKLVGFVTTREGGDAANSILSERLDASRQDLVNILHALPPKLAQFIIEECILLTQDWGRGVERPRFGFGFFVDTMGDASSREEPLHSCLLNDERVLRERNKFFEAAIEKGLIVKAHSYVSTRGGELRELVCVPAQELRDFLQGYLNDAGITGPLFRPELEAKHRIYHLLKRWEPVTKGERVMIQQLPQYAALDESVRSEADQAFDRLVREGLLISEEGVPTVVNPASYEQFIKKEYFLPLVENLLESGPQAPSMVKETTPKPKEEEVPVMPFQITFPPYDNGSCLVFGRGALKDKIALGFEYEESPSPESLVFWELHDINEAFVASFQQVGMGKSTLANCVMLQSAFQGVPVIVFDPKPDYVASLVPVSRFIKEYPDKEKGIKERFESAMQDMRGFDLTKPLEFKFGDKELKLVHQVYSFNPDLHHLGVRALKMPLAVLPPASAPNFKEICASAATTLASSLHSRFQQMAYNATLLDAMQNFKNRNPDVDYMLPGDLEDELERIIEGETEKAERTRLRNLMRALKGYVTANAWLYASTKEEVARFEDLVQNPGYKDSDGKTVTITVLDVSFLPQDTRNPARQNYVSQVCGFLYNLANRKRSSRAAQFLIVFDEAHNYLPEPTDRFNNTLVLIRQGRSLGIKALVIAQSPQQIEIEARHQAHCLVLSKITTASVREELSKFQPNESWVEKLGRTDRGHALIVDNQSAKNGGVLCTLFTTPQTIAKLNSEEIMSLSHAPKEENTK